MNEATKGVVAMIAVCVIFGFSPLYYKQLTHVPPLEVLSHRTIWSLGFLAILLMVQGRVGQVFQLLRSGPNFMRVFFAAIMISTNWGLYIYAIQIGKTVESSLGYYIFPLIAVLLGVVFLRERLSVWKWAAVGLATIAVLTLTIGLGAAPWISLALAITFGFYGLLKKASVAGPVVSVTAEVLILAPLALLWLWGVHHAGWQGLVGRDGGMFGQNWRDTALLMFSGPLTAVPLIMMSYALKRITLATLGLVQYLNPTLQFVCAVLIFQEPFTKWHGVAFPLIWLALAIYSAEAIRQERAARRAVVNSSTSDTDLK